MLKLIFLASFAACAAAIPAQATEFTKTFTGDSGSPITANFTFTTSDTVNARGGYDVLGMSGSVGNDLITGFLANPTPGISSLSPDKAWIYDDIYYDENRILDSDGVVFTTASGAEYNFWGDSATSYTLASKVSDSSGKLVNGPGYNGFVDTPPPPPPPPVTHPSSSPTILTFEGLQPSTSQSPPYSNPYISTEGYQFVSAGNCCNFVGTQGLSTPANGEQFLSYTLFDTSMTAVDGSLFSVTSLDAGNSQFQSGAHALLLTGIRADGSQVLQTLGIGDGFQNFSLNGFTDLVSLKFGAIGSGYTAIDNIVAAAGGPGTVPEPASWTFMLGGFSLVGGAMRRRKAIVAFS